MLKDDFKFWLMPLMGGGGAPWEDGPVSKVLAAKYRDPSAPPDPGNRAPPYRRKKKVQNPATKSYQSHQFQVTLEGSTPKKIHTQPSC